ncbi:hypothetical protein VTN02DRAFT_5909 [Thermoascus thermophilus]
MATPRSPGIPNGGTSLNATQDPANIVKGPVTPGRSRVAASPSTNRSTTRLTPRDIGVGVPSTPYGLQAIQRRAANTPGRDRRKSGRMQRETPFDILKNLGRALAPTSQPIRSSPEDELRKEHEFDDLDDEPDIERPRLSLPIDDELEEGEEQEEDEDDDRSPEIQPPRLSLTFEDTTQRSVEYPRRALSERHIARSSRMSFGDVRLSENFADLSRLDGTSQDDDYATVRQDEDDEAESTTIPQNVFSTGRETEDLRSFKLDFNFPIPNATSAILDTEPENNDEEEFALSLMDVQPNVNFLSSDNGVTGTFGLDIRTPDQVSDAGTTGMVGESQGEPALRGAKLQKLSRHSMYIPHLPPGVVKRLATRFARVGAGAKTKISKETLAAIEQATEWFFEQASEDLATYSSHAGRKTIDESDVLTLMKR